MGIFDGIGASLQEQAAKAIAAKMGIDPAMAELAIGALTKNHSAPVDTIQQSAQETGISGDVLGQIVSQIGGGGGLGALVGAVTGAGAAVADPTQPDEQAPAGGGLGGILAGLGGIGGIAKMIDQDGDGNPLDEIAGMLGKS